MRSVKDILSTKTTSFNSISSDTLVIDAINLLNSVNLSYVVVMDKDQYKGIFSERDYTRNVILKGRSSKETPVSDVMTTDFPIVDITDTVEECMHLMNSFKTRYLLAYDDQDFKGVITIHDLLREVLASREMVFDHSLTRELIDTDEKNRIF